MPTIKVFEVLWRMLVVAIESAVLTSHLPFKLPIPSDVSFGCRRGLFSMSST